MRLLPFVVLMSAVIALTAGTALTLTPDGRPEPLLALFSGNLPPIERELLWQLRLPRQLLAFTAGALLAAAGGAIQARFKNPLAEPGLIGISGGAALSAALALQCGLPTPWVPLAAFGGGLAALGLTSLMSRPGTDGDRLILAGIAVNAIFGSLLTILIATLPDGSLRTITFWLMGSFANADWPQAERFVIAAPILLWLLFREWRLLNALQLGAATAFHLGFDVRRGGARVVLLAALATALVVSHCGMVGFVGLMAPHLARQLVGSHARRLQIAAPLLGGWLALLADWLAHSLIYPAELPVGVITSLAGAPFFLWLLWQSNRRRRHA
ncbi:MAG: iron ABC transporter permease [Paludibacterium sp.]|uniref:FecCD family ABC transporter permease n=1 Tax=Paludibacterium sp. TaxID=1917523 RepID=UPI0025FECC83|nr:iron ABC transporter permease [Paludibacterium sp.]MBV8049195.1 iron ABC transporter permease [Paludibacterium sp.]MBV8647264.1 iron ABC transporter permease [Paludibacterium sp.]